jgi:hypothetical protein
VDGLRVAISRATETLIIMDIMPDETELMYSRKFLEEVESVPVNGAELVEQMNLADLSAEELVQMMINDANRNAGADLDLAIRRARQAVKLLGRPGTPNGVADATLRSEAHETLAKVLMTRYSRTDQADTDVLSEMVQLFRKAERRESERLFRKIRDYHRMEVDKRHDLLWEIAELLPAGGDQSWIRSGLHRDHKEWLGMFTRASRDGGHAFAASRHIEKYLLYHNRNRPFDAEKLEKLNTWRTHAARTLLDCGKYEQALQVAKQISPHQPLLCAQCLEGLGHYAEAMGLYEEAGELSDACRVARRIPDIDQAMRLMESSGANGDELEALRWLTSFRGLIAAKPQDVHELLTAEENHFMQDLVKSCLQDIPQPRRQKVSQKLKGAPSSHEHSRR